MDRHLLEDQVCSYDERQELFIRMKINKIREGLSSSAAAQRQPVKDAEQPSHDVTSKSAAEDSSETECDNSSTKVSCAN